MLNTIRLSAPATKTERREVADTYEICYEGKGIRKLLYDMSMKVLRWLGTATPYVQTTIVPYYRETLVELDPNKIIDALYTNAMAISAIHNRKVDMIIVGRDAFPTIMKSMLNRFDTPFDITLGNYHSTWALGGSPLTLYGMKIKYLPWFEGVVLVPLD